MTEPSTEEPGQPPEEGRPEGSDTQPRTGAAETVDEPDSGQIVRHIHIEINASIVDVPAKPKPLNVR